MLLLVKSQTVELMRIMGEEKSVVWEAAQGSARSGNRAGRRAGGGASRGRREATGSGHLLSVNRVLGKEEQRRVLSVTLKTR